MARRRPRFERCPADEEMDCGVGNAELVWSLVALVAGCVVCAVATYADRLVSSRSLRVDTAIAWVLLLPVFVWRVELSGWSTDLYWAGAAAYWSLLAWTGFRPFYIATRLWSDTARAKPGRIARARVAQVGFAASMVAIGIWIVLNAPELTS